MHYIKIVCFNCRNSDNLHRELTVDMNEKLTLSELEEDVLLMAYKDAVIFKVTARIYFSAKTRNTQEKLRSYS